jgi:hypothetical protein
MRTTVTASTGRNVWRVSDGKHTTDYIRAGSLDEANAIFNGKHHFTSASEAQVVDHPIHAVFFTDNPFSPAFFKGTKTDAQRGARLYIRQWGLDASIDRIETI